MTVASTTPALDPAVAVICPRCAYILRGLRPQDSCPECGEPASRAFQPHWLHFEPPGRLLRYESGALLLAAAAFLLLLSVLGIVLAALIPGGPGGPRSQLTQIVAWGSTISAPLAALGIILVTLRNAAGGSRAALTCLALAAVTFPVVAWMRPTLGGSISATTHLSIRVVFLSAWIGLVFFGIRALATTVARAPGSRGLPSLLRALAWSAVPLGCLFVAAQTLLSLAIAWLGQTLDGTRPPEYIAQMLIWSRRLSVVSGIGWVLWLFVAAPALGMGGRAIEVARQAARRARA